MTDRPRKEPAKARAWTQDRPPSRPLFSDLLGGEFQKPAFETPDSNLQSKPPIQESQPGTNVGRNLGQLASELLKPILKEWIDRHLEGLVEDLVREEIRRIARNRS